MTTPPPEQRKKRRDALRATRLRPVQIWLPDTRSRAFVAECRRQSLLVAQAAIAEADTLCWLEQAADTEGWR